MEQDSKDDKGNIGDSKEDCETSPRCSGEINESGNNDERANFTVSLLRNKTIT